MAFPLSALHLNDVISLFPGPFIGTNYVGSLPATCTVTLVGTGSVSVQYNATTIVVGANNTPNPNSWIGMSTFSSPGTFTLNLTPRSVSNWIRVILASVGTGTCTVAATWQPVGSVIDEYEYQGTWDASANNPTLASSIGPNGGYYVVIAPGTTTLNGIATWAVGDTVIFNRTAWIKIPAIVVASP
jgi:hypothetical protein